MGGVRNALTKWITLCHLAEAPAPGHVLEVEVDGISVCLANIEGELSALDNWCPHRRGPLGQGWIEGQAVICPWHSWAFDARTGLADYPANERVAVFPIQIADECLVVEVPDAPSAKAEDPDPKAAESASEL